MPCGRHSRSPGAGTGPSSRISGSSFRSVREPERGWWRSGPTEAGRRAPPGAQEWRSAKDAERRAPAGKAAPGRRAAPNRWRRTLEQDDADGRAEVAPLSAVLGEIGRAWVRERVGQDV